MRQIMFGSSVDNRVNAIIPDQYNDNGSGIASEYQPGFYPNDGNYVLQAGGVSGQAAGNGDLLAKPIIDDVVVDAAETPRRITLSAGNRIHFEEIFDGISEHVSVNFTNDRDVGGAPIPDTWIEFHDVTLYAHPYMQPRSY
jgi:hypothetical protein